MKCEKCNKEHNGIYGSGRFCSAKCARSFSRGKCKPRNKIVNCVTCGKEIIVNKRASNKLCKCDDCKIKNIKKFKNKCNICGSFKCFRKDICNKKRIFPTLIKYFGFNKTVIGTIKVYEEFERIKNLIIEDYNDNKLSTIDLAKKYNHTHYGNFNKILDSLGIKKRNFSESIRLAIYKGKLKIHSSKQYKCGWHTTWNNKKIYYRSSYELDYAKQLDEKKINYEMENLRILYWDSQLNKQRIAIPDFYIKEQNMIIEVKCDYTYDEQNMIDKIKSYKKHGYNFKLILNKKEKKFNFNAVA